MKLECGHDHEITEELALCSECSKYMPISKATRNYSDHPLYGFSAFSSTHWGVIFSCGHTDKIYKINQGSWCFSCKSWQLYSCKQEAKEREMRWNGKKFWRLYSVSNHQVLGFEHESLAKAEAEAESMSQQHNGVYLVLETVSGFSPKKQTERVKFEK